MLVHVNPFPAVLPEDQPRSEHHHHLSALLWKRFILELDFTL